MALAAAFALAISSRGDVVVLAVLLGLGAGRRSSGLAAASALGASLVRWGSSGLGAIAGAQAVLGPAGWTGSGLAVASSWLAALALLTAAVPVGPDRPWVAALSVSPFGLAAADVAAGPAPGGALLVRVLASVAAIVASTGIALLPPRVARVRRVSVALGLAALVGAGLAR